MKNARGRKELPHTEKSRSRASAGSLLHESQYASCAFPDCLEYQGVVTQITKLYLTVTLLGCIFYLYFSLSGTDKSRTLTKRVGKGGRGR